MGQTHKPLVIGVTDPDLLAHPKVQELRDKGHTIVLAPEYDLTIGRKAWFMDSDHIERYLDVALRHARKARYAKGEA